MGSMTSVSISAARLVVLAVLAVAGARIYRHRWWVALEQPWTPSTEVVMKPSLTLNQMITSKRARSSGE